MLRPVKAVLLLVVAYWLYWAVTSVTFHYLYRVDIWSPAIWESVDQVWESGGNLRWSTFWNLVAITLVWYFGLVVLWTRISRVWVAFKRWGGRFVMWTIRASVFLSVSYLLLILMDIGFWQMATEFAGAVATFPYVPEATAQIPLWASMVVFGIFGLVLLNLIIIVVEIIVEVLAFGSKLLNVAVYGGIVNADKFDADEVEPRVVLGLVQRFQRANRRGAVWYEEYTRRKVLDEANSSIGDDGFLKSRDADAALTTGPKVAGTAAPGSRWWWPFGVKQRRLEPSLGDSGEAADAQAAAQEVSVSETATDELEDTPEESPPQASGQQDAATRDAFLAPDADEMVEQPRAGEEEPDDEDAGQEEPSRGVEDLPLVAREEEEKNEFDAARQVEQAEHQERMREHAERIAEERRDAAAQADFGHYNDDADLVADSEDDLDPFDPESEFDVGGEIPADALTGTGFGPEEGYGASYQSDPEDGGDQPKVASDPTESGSDSAATSEEDGALGGEEEGDVAGDDASSGGFGPVHPPGAGVAADRPFGLERFAGRSRENEAAGRGSRAAASDEQEVGGEQEQSFGLDRFPALGEPADAPAPPGPAEREDGAPAGQAVAEDGDEPEPDLPPSGDLFQSR